MAWVRGYKTSQILPTFGNCPSVLSVPQSHWSSPGHPKDSHPWECPVCPTSCWEFLGHLLAKCLNIPASQVKHDRLKVKVTLHDKFMSYHSTQSLKCVYRRSGNFHCENIFVVCVNHENKKHEAYFTTNNYHSQHTFAHTVSQQS